MSDVKNLYILKQPVEVIETFDESAMMVAIPHMFNGREWTRTPMKPDTFNEHFTPLDVESLTTQLEDILQNFWQDEDQDLDDSVAEVLELIGITKEQK